MNLRAYTSALPLALLLTAAGPAIAQPEPAVATAALGAQPSQPSQATQQPSQPRQVARNTEAAPSAGQTDPAVLEERMRGMRIEYQSGFELMQAEHRAMRSEHGAMRADHETMRAEYRAGFETILAKMDADHAALRTEIAQLENRLILWLVGWTTGLMALLPLYLALLRRYLPKLLGDPPPAA